MLKFFWGFRKRVENFRTNLVETRVEKGPFLFVTFEHSPVNVEIGQNSTSEEIYNISRHLQNYHQKSSAISPIQ